MVMVYEWESDVVATLSASFKMMLDLVHIVTGNESR